MSDVDPATLGTHPSLSSAPSCTTSAPFSKLPPELVQQIIESTVPPQYHSETYFPRQQVLLSLCLVSKLFHEIARPLLFAVVVHRPSRVYTYTDWRTFEVEGDRPALVRELIFDSKFSLKLDWRQYVGLRLLVINFDRCNIDLARFGELPNLTVLRLAGPNIWAGTPFSLDRLQELELFFPMGDLPGDSMTPTSLPSLRKLAYYACGSTQECTIASFPTSLVPQLELLVLPYEFVDLFEPELLKQLNHITLWDVQLENLQSLEAPISYLRVEAEDDLDDYDDPVTAVLDLLEETLRLRPSLLYLPPCLEKFVYSDYHEYFRTSCEKLGIEIVWEEGIEEWYLNSGFSQDFRKRMERKRIEGSTAR